MPAQRRVALDCEVWLVSEQSKITEFRCLGDPEDPADLRELLVGAVVRRGRYSPRRIPEFELRLKDTRSQKQLLPHVFREDDDRAK